MLPEGYMEGFCSGMPCFMNCRRMGQASVCTRRVMNWAPASWQTATRACRAACTRAGLLSCIQQQASGVTTLHIHNKNGFQSAVHVQRPASFSTSCASSTINGRIACTTSQTRRFQVVCSVTKYMFLAYNLQSGSTILHRLTHLVALSQLQVH